MVVKVSYEKPWWANNITDDKPSFNLFETLKNSMQEKDLYVNFISTEMISVVIPDLTIKYIWINHSNFDWYYFQDRIDKVLPEGYEVIFRIDLFNTFTQKSLKLIYDSGDELYITRCHKRNANFFKIDDEVFTSIPYDFQENIYSITQEFLDLTNGNNAASYQGYFYKWRSYLGWSNYELFRILGLHPSANSSTTVRNGNLWAAFYNDILSPASYILIPILDVGFAHQPWVSSSTSSIVVRSGSDKIIQTPFYGEDDEDFTTGDVDWCGNTLENVLYILNNMSSFSDSHFIGLFYGPPYTNFNVGYYNSFQISNKSESQGTDLVGRITTRGSGNLYCMLYNPSSQTTGNLDIIVGENAGKEYQYYGSLYPINGTFNATLGFKTCGYSGQINRDNLLSSSYIHFYLLKYIPTYITPTDMLNTNLFATVSTSDDLANTVKISFDYRLVFNAGFNLVIDNAEIGWESNVINFGGIHPSISSAFREYLMANQQTWNTSMANLPGQMMAGAIQSGANAAIGARTLASAGNYPVQAYAGGAKQNGEDVSSNLYTHYGYPNNKWIGGLTTENSFSADTPLGLLPDTARYVSNPLFSTVLTPNFVMQNLGAGAIAGAASSVVSSINNIVSSVNNLKAQQASANVSYGAKVRDGNTEYIKWVNFLINKSQLTSSETSVPAYSLLVSSYPTKKTINLFNKMLYLYGIKSTSRYLLSEIYLVNDFIADKKCSFIQMDPINFQFDLFKYIPDNCPLNYWQLILNDLTIGLRIWDEVPDNV